MAMFNSYVKLPEGILFQPFWDVQSPWNSDGHESCQMDWKRHHGF